MQVACRGTEDRLLDCKFPENFSDDDTSTDNIESSSDDDGPDSARRPGASPAAVTALPPSNGVLGGKCANSDVDRFAVVCRSFEISGETPPELKVMLTLDNYICLCQPGWTSCEEATQD